MTLNSTIETHLWNAVADARHEAQEHWRQTPGLCSTAALTSASVSGGGPTVTAEMTFETHRQNIPTGQRDAYGVASGTHTAHQAQTTKPAGVPTLMRETEKTLEAAFIKSIETRMR